MRLKYRLKQWFLRLAVRLAHIRGKFHDPLTISKEWTGNPDLKDTEWQYGNFKQVWHSPPEA